ncbi:isochorismate-pyruvate lyase, partial [Vibrio vulnificus]
NEQGLSEEYVEALFDNIIQWYISQQIQHWRSQKGLAPVSQD